MRRMPARSLRLGLSGSANWTQSQQYDRSDPYSHDSSTMFGQPRSPGIHTRHRSLFEQQRHAASASPTVALGDAAARDVPLAPISWRRPSLSKPRLLPPSRRAGAHARAARGPATAHRALLMPAPEPLIELFPPSRRSTCRRPRGRARTASGGAAASSTATARGDCARRRQNQRRRDRDGLCHSRHRILIGARATAIAGRVIGFRKRRHVADLLRTSMLEMSGATRRKTIENGSTPAESASPGSIRSIPARSFFGSDGAPQKMVA